MDIELGPPRGITGFPFGMPAEEVKEAAAALGQIQVQDEGSSDEFHPMKVLALHPQFEITFTREAGHEVPLDTDGEPLYFQSVLAGPENYYDLC